MKTRALKPGHMVTGGEKASYWSYMIGQNFTYTMVASYLGTYMMMIGVDVSKTAAVMLLVKIWDAINDALFGIIFDKIKFKSKNKCLPWIRLSSALIPFTTILLYVIPQDSPEMLKLIWFTVAYVLWDTAYTVSDVPIYGMVTTMTNNMDERNQIMSFARIFGSGGGMVASMAISVMVSEKVGLDFGWVSFIICMLALVFMLPICFKGKERNRLEHAEEGYTFRQMFSYLKTNKFLLLLFGSYIIQASLSTFNSLGLFVSYYLFGSATFNTLLVAVMAVPMALIAFLLPTVLKKVDKFTAYFSSLLANAVIGFLIYFLGYGNATVYIILRAIQAVPIAVAVIVSFMFTPDCAEYGQYKTGTDARGITFAIQTFSSKVSSAIASSLGLAILGLFGWVSINASSFAEIEALNIVQPDQAITGLWFTYTLVPAIGSALALIPLFFYKLRDKDVRVMAQYNSGEITREAAEALLSRKY